MPEKLRTENIRLELSLNHLKCAPPEYTYQPDNCPANAIRIGDIPKLNVYPGMEDLVECQSVKDAFSEILRQHCKPLKRSAQMAWAAMVVLSIIMVVLVLIWTTQARHDQELHSLDGSVKPQSSTTNSLELQPNNEVI
ncbi:hypothetical protein REPUB_Repub20aG0027700 [Reevesia pubescens]